MTRIIRLVLLAMVAVSTSASSAHGQDSFVEADNVSNAALLYWQAFALLPKLDEKQQKQLENAVSAEQFDTDVFEIIDQCSDSFGAISSIAPDMNCKWELLRNGPLTNLPHLGKAKTLATLLVVRGRKELLLGNLNAANERFAQALLVGRNIDAGCLVTAIVGNSIDQMVTDAVTPNLNLMKPESINNLNKLIAALPPRVTLREAIESEGELCVGWFDELFEEDPSVATAKLSMVYQSPQQVSAIMSGTKDDRMSNLKEMKTFYQQLATLAGQSTVTPDSLSEFNQAVNQTRNLLATGHLPSTAVFERFEKSEQAWQNFLKSLNKGDN